MKKNILIIGIMLLATVMVQAQHRELKKLFKNIENVDGFSLKILDPEIDIEVETMNTFSHFINDAKHIYVMKFDEEKGKTSNYQKLHAKVEKIIEKYNFESMMEVGDDGENVKIFLRKNKKERVSDFLLITDDGDEGAIVWATTF